MEIEAQAQALKRGRPSQGVVPRRIRESPAEEQRKKREYEQVVAAWEKEMAEAEGKPPPDLHALRAAEFRESWYNLSERFGDFEDTTKIPSMRFTDNPARPDTACVFDTLQIFSVKVAALRGGLQWPLHVFGTVALRDSVDRNRNIIFHRKRDNCQTLTLENPNLVVTGPTRAVVLMFPITFEVELTVKGMTESEDKCLSYLAAFLTPDSRIRSCLFVRSYTSKLSTVEFTHAHIYCSVEATITVQIVRGSWRGYRSQFLACTASINQEVLLLDSGDKEVPVTSDGKIELSREVASVELSDSGKIIVLVKVLRGDNFIDTHKIDFTPKQDGRSYGRLNVGFCTMEVTVAWSLITVERSP